MVQRLCEHRAVSCDHRDANLLRPLCDQEIADTRPGRWQEAARRGVWRVLESIVGAVHADEHLDLVVVGREFLVGQRPVESQPVAAARLEVIGTVAEGIAPPVVGPSAEHSSAPPVKASRILLRGIHVRFARHLPAPVDGGIVKTEWLVGRRCATQRGLASRLEHRGLVLGHVVAPGLEHQDPGAGHAERVGGLPAGGAGPHDDDVIVPECCGGDEWHCAGSRQSGTTA